MTTFDIAGFDSTYKVPRFAARIDFGAGRLAPPGNKCLLVAMITSSGSMTVGAAPIQCTSEDDADAFCGPGSQLATMVYTALKEAEGESLDLWIAAVAEPTGTKATVTITPTAAQPSPGTVYIWIAGRSIACPVLAGDTADTWGANAVLAINGNPKLPCTAAYATGVLTITIKNKGVQGKDWQCFVDMAQAPASFTIALAGSASSGTNRVRFGATSTGTGTEDVTALLVVLAGTRWARIAPAQYDTTNAALWKSFAAAEAGPLALRLEHYYFGFNGAFSAALTLGQTTLNDQRGRVRWFRNSEAHPSQIGAANAVLAAVTEVDTPNPNYDGYQFKSLPPQRFSADVPSDTEQNTALNNGVTPLSTVDNAAVMVRAVCTHSLTGGFPDFRTLDDGEATFPDAALYRLQARWIQYKEENPRVGPDPADGEPEPPEGVAHPATWNDELFSEMNAWYANGEIQDPPSTPDNTTKSTYGTIYATGPKRLQSGIGFVVAPANHQLGMILKQVAA